MRPPGRFAAGSRFNESFGSVVFPVMVFSVVRSRYLPSPLRCPQETLGVTGKLEDVGLTTCELKVQVRQDADRLVRDTLAKRTPKASGLRSPRGAAVAQM